MSGMWRVTAVLGAMTLALGCGDSDSSGPSTPAPIISNLIVSTGPNRTLVFQMGASDPDADLVGGHCTFTALGFAGLPTMSVAAAVPPNPNAPLTVTCTLPVPVGLTGRPVTGTIGVSDAKGNASNTLRFTATLPEHLRGPS